MNGSIVAKKHNDRYNATPAFTQITLVFQVLHSKGPLNKTQFRRPVVGRLVDELTACFIIMRNIYRAYAVYAALLHWFRLNLESAFYI